MCHDKRAIVYHADGLEDLVQSFVGIRPIAGTFIDAIGVVCADTQCSGTFVAKALLAAGLPPSLALAPMDGDLPLYSEDEALVAGQPAIALADFFAPDHEEEER
jgi:hypothetical protein